MDKKFLVDNLEIKIIISAFMVAISWVFNAEYEALIVIFSLRFIDFSTGTMWAIKNKCWCSSASTKGIYKTGVYFILMLSCRLADKTFPVPFASPILDTWIVVTELGSIIENFHKMGYSVPVMLVNKLKSFQEKK
jgi:toxin secretion/phage lysis holin